MLDITRIFEAVALFIDQVMNFGVGMDFSVLVARLKIISVLVSILLFWGIVHSVRSMLAINKKRKLVTVLDIWADLPITKRVSKWDGVVRRMDSVNPADWNMAILEADSLLDEIVRRIGYRGDSLGERLKNIEPSDFDALQDIWEAHKVRNRIAHEGANFTISRDEAQRTIKLYEKGLKELQYIS